MDHTTRSETNEITSPIRRLSGGLARLLSPDVDEDDGSALSPRSDRRYSYGSMSGSKSVLDAGAYTDLGNILEDEELHAPLDPTQEGVLDEEDEDSEYFYDSDSDDEAQINARMSNLSSSSFHLGNSTRMSAKNIMVHERVTSSFLKHGDEYELVNTQLKNNVRLVEDVNLIGDAKGRLYLAQYSFFKNCHDLKFAMTVQPDIYEKIMAEVSDALNIPCDLYFCCHGGDGAHTGVSHSDSVNIKLAWFFFLMTMVILMSVEYFA